VAFGIIGIAKQKGGSVGSSGHHNDRTRETPNADPERQHLNRVLIGDDQNVRVAVDRIIEEHGGKPRRDSVEAVEFLLTASPEWFEEQYPEKRREKVERFVGQAVKFLEDPRSGGRLAKAVLHMDERTPHVQAHKVPIDPEGKLNAKHYFGGRQKMAALHDLYHEYVGPLGLERGQRGSRATHQTLKRFYGSIEQEVTLDINRDKIPDPPRVMLTEEARDEYKRKVERSVLKQFLEKFRVIRDQAMLAKDEQARRVEAERRAEQRVAEIEARAREQIAEVKREAADRLYNLEQSARKVLDENRELHEQVEGLTASRDSYFNQLASEKVRAHATQKRAERLSERLTDIPMLDVMERMGYGRGEEKGDVNLFRDAQGRVAMAVSAREQKALDSQGRLISRNSLDLVVQMQKQNEGREDYTLTDGLRWLAQEFGDRNATAALAVNREHWAAAWFGREREFGRLERSPHEHDRAGVGAHDRTGFGDHDRGHDRAGSRDRGGHDFGR